MTGVDSKKFIGGNVDIHKARISAGKTKDTRTNSYYIKALPLYNSKNGPSDTLKSTCPGAVQMRAPKKRESDPKPHLVPVTKRCSPNRIPQIQGTSASSPLVLRIPHGVETPIAST